MNADVARPGDILWGLFAAQNGGERLHPALVVGRGPKGLVLLVGSTKALAGGSGPGVIQLNPGEPGFEATSLRGPTCFRQVDVRSSDLDATRRGKLASQVHLRRLEAVQQTARRARLIA